MSGAAQPAAGRRFEYRVRDDLRANGYWVMRSPASKSPVDLVAIKPGQVLFVQCKRDGRLDPDEWNAFCQLAWSADVKPILANSDGGYERRPPVYWLLEGLKVHQAPRGGARREFRLDEVSDRFAVERARLLARIDELEQAEMAARDALTERTGR